MDYVIFIIAVLFRVFSGGQNGSAYAGRLGLSLSFTILMTVCCLIYYPFGFTENMWPTVSCAVFPVVLYVVLSRRVWYRWIHPLEYAAQAAFFVATALVNWKAAVFAVYPGMIGFTVLKNICQGLPLFYYGTDDSDGSHTGYHVPDILVGKVILYPYYTKDRGLHIGLYKVPEKLWIRRNSLWVRLVLTSASIAAFFLL